MRMSYLRFRALSSLFVALTMLPLHAHAQQQTGTQSFQFMNPALPDRSASQRPHRPHDS